MSAAGIIISLLALIQPLATSLKFDTNLIILLSKSGILNTIHYEKMFQSLFFYEPSSYFK